MGGRRKKARHVRSHSNKYQKYSKAEKLMEKQINEEIHSYILNEPEPVNSEESLESEFEEKVTCDSEDEFEVSYYKDIKPYSGEVRRGEIYFFDKGPKVGVEQQGGRPGIIVSNNLCNKYSEFVEVVYTTCQPKTELPTHIAINSTPKPCTALCEQIHTLSKKKIRCYYGEVTAEEECEINKALAINLALTQDVKYDNSCSVDELELLKTQLDAALEANQGYEQEAKMLEDEIEDLKARLMIALASSEKDIAPSVEGNIYKNLYHELLDKILRLKLQEEK